MIQKILDSIVNFLEALDKKLFYRYGAIFLALVMALSIFMLYMYRETNIMSLKQMKKIGQMHTDIIEILQKNQQVETQRAAVNEMLDENPYFKIKNFLTELLKKLNLTSDVISTSESVNVNDNNYLDIVASVKLIDISMQELTELLQEIEQNNRVHIRSLEITQKKPKFIDVNLTIATLSKKVISSEV